MPEELTHHEFINAPTLYTTNQYVGSSHSKSKSRTVSAATCSPAFGASRYAPDSPSEKRNPIFGPTLPNPQLVVSNNYVVHAPAPLQALQERGRSPQRLQTHSVSPSLQFKGSKENALHGTLGTGLQPNGGEYSLARRVSQPEVGYPEELQGSTPTHNLLNLMREQLELANKAFTARFAEEMRRNN